MICSNPYLSLSVICTSHGYGPAPIAISHSRNYMMFDYRGIINTPGNVKIYGFLGEARMANQLPQYFDPTE